MAKHRRGRRQLEGSINVVPYIDVMLVLLVIFMVTAPLISQSVIDLPVAGDVGNTQQNEAIEIQLPADGTYTVKDYNFGAEEVNLHTVEDAILLVRERRELFPDAPLLIAADRNLQYEKVVELLARLHEEGIQNIGLMTRTTE